MKTRKVVVAEGLIVVDLIETDKKDPLHFQLRELRPRDIVWGCRKCLFHALSRKYIQTKPWIHTQLTVASSSHDHQPRQKYGPGILLSPFSRQRAKAMITVTMTIAKLRLRQIFL